RKVTIVGFGGPVTEEIVKSESETVYQHEQKGTGHAIMQAAPMLAGLDGLTLIVCGDTPLLKTSTLSKLIKQHEEAQNNLTVLSAIVPNPRGYGRIVRGVDGLVNEIVEQADVDENQNAINEVNAGVYVFDNKMLFEYLKNLKPNNAQGEYYLTDLIKMFKNDGLRIGASIAEDYKEMLGINDRRQLEEAAHIMARRINERHMLAGVTIEDSNSTFIGPDVVIGQDTVIRPGTHILGVSVIGKDNVIGPATYLDNVTIGDGNHVIFSHIADSVIGNANEVGPYARIRGHSVIANHNRLGNFVEFKACVLHDGAKAAHLSYLGDVEIGEKTNIGCGTIVANYDGYNKTKTLIGNDVFVGSGSTLISPIVVEDHAYIAAGSTINRNVLKDEMAIARARQENKPGYGNVVREKALQKKLVSQKK
ncbi:MAG: bifunctional UDP-N-acetylglucosamine diphosphorylase/glucosamine-1-phosphate N-acetyltransferase GlmU, partial [Bacilli bacterium]|nr:bifunctional UDP-N-acetylglucosamine diphosphorylase/glucosamine-1-phosphate N-acetyltransferase GlmU [Bacilli bacterium]MDD4006063.1 bifunctional UDP-N-acetylglucosamine diphosphorylase/glucosamine-1-phosphate N-acetyltransferase GlmU [Bacilli bacterium]